MWDNIIQKNIVDIDNFFTDNVDIAEKHLDLSKTYYSEPFLRIINRNTKHFITRKMRNLDNKDFRESENTIFYIEKYELIKDIVYSEKYDFDRIRFLGLEEGYKYDILLTMYDTYAYNSENYFVQATGTATLISPINDDCLEFLFSGKKSNGETLHTKMKIFPCFVNGELLKYQISFHEV